MALLTYDWRAPDPTGAVNAYLAGVGVGTREAALRAEQAQNSQENLQRAVKLTQAKQQADIDMAMQLLQESRLNRAAQIQEQFTESRIKNADAVTKARVGAYNRANQAPEPWTPLPETGAEEAAPTTSEAPVTQAGGSGDVLNWEANAGEPGDVALSLTEASPFRREADFMGTTADDRADAVPAFSDGPLLESANEFGGDNPSPIVGTAPTASAPSIAGDMPLPSGAADDLSSGLMAGNDARTPADQVLSPAAVKRVNVAGATGGAKAAQAQVKVELGVAARGNKPETAAKPLTRNFPDGSFRQWDAATSTWDILAEKPAKTDKPTVRNFADGTTRQYDPETNTWIVQAEKQAADEKAVAEKEARARQDQLIQRANHQRSVVSDLERKLFKTDGTPIVVEWPWEEDGKFYRMSEDRKKREAITKEQHDAMMSRNGRLQESASELAREKSKLTGFESQIDGFDTGAAPAATGKLYKVEGKTVNFANGSDFAKSVQQAVDDGLITADQGRETLRKAGFTPKAK